MTPQKPTIDSNSDPALSKLFQEIASGEPPAALDAAILAAAHEAIAPRPRQRPWWLRLQAPFAVAATVVLAVMLTLTMERNPPESLESSAKPEASEASPIEQKRSDKAASLEQRSQTEAMQPAKPAKPEAKAKSAEPLPPPRPAHAPAPEVAHPATENAVAERKPAAPAIVPAPPAAAAPSSFEAPSGIASGAAGKLSELTSPPTKAEAPLQKAKPAVAMDAAPAPASAAAPMRLRSEVSNEAPSKQRSLTPEDWISQIRLLRQQGQEAEATRQLQAFRKAYPDYKLPEDLR